MITSIKSIIDTYWDILRHLQINSYCVHRKCSGPKDLVGSETKDYLTRCCNVCVNLHWCTHGFLQLGMCWKNWVYFEWTHLRNPHKRSVTFWNVNTCVTDDTWFLTWSFKSGGSKTGYWAMPPIINPACAFKNVAALLPGLTRFNLHNLHYVSLILTRGN